MATEDFSFPVIVNDFPCPIDSPPLWHLSPAASPNSCQEEPAATRGKGNKEEDEEDCFASETTRNIQRKSFSCVHGKEDDHEEEKMDMLWEDFNEELARASNARTSASSSRDRVELGCVKGLITSKNNGAGALSTKKPGMVVIVKLVLKKLFLLQSSHRRLKIKGPHGGQ